MSIETTLNNIETLIDAAVAHEAQTGLLAERIREVAEDRHEPGDDEAVTKALDFVTRYVRAVPRLLKEALDRSADTFAADKMRRMAEAATVYWEEEDDVIPDEYGLFGILDDAYCTLSLIAALSTCFEEQAGHPLVAADLEGPNAAARVLMGEENTRQLDDYVEEALADATLQELLQCLEEQHLPAPTVETPAEDDQILRMFGVL